MVNSVWEGLNEPPVFQGIVELRSRTKGVLLRICSLASLGERSSAVYCEFGFSLMVDSEEGDAAKQISMAICWSWKKGSPLFKVKVKYGLRTAAEVRLMVDLGS